MQISARHPSLTVSQWVTPLIRVLSWKGEKGFLGCQQALKSAGGKMLLGEVRGRQKCSGQVGHWEAKTREKSRLDRTPWGPGEVQTPAHPGLLRTLCLSSRNMHFSSAPGHQSLDLNVSEPKITTPHISSEVGRSILPSPRRDPEITEQQARICNSQRIREAEIVRSQDVICHDAQ